MVAVIGDRLRMNLLVIAVREPLMCMVIRDDGVLMPIQGQAQHGSGHRPPHGEQHGKQQQHVDA